jgi:hypothetical protein
MMSFNIYSAWISSCCKFSTVANKPLLSYNPSALRYQVLRTPSGSRSRLRELLISFDYAPKLYGDTTARPAQKVTGFNSGVESATKVCIVLVLFEKGVC